jgi:hypothetical protein
MRGAVRTLRKLQWAFLGSVLLFAAAGGVLRANARAIEPSAAYLFTTIAVAIVGVIFVVRRTLVLRSASSLARQPDDSLSLTHWKNGYIVTYALCEALALFGLILRIMGCNFSQSMPFYIGGFTLLFFFGPREVGGSVE